MASDERGRVVLRGRFKVGSVVSLVRVENEAVLRAEGGVLVAQKVVGDDGVAFDDNVIVGGRYFVVGQIDGQPVEVRVRGNVPGEESQVLTQPGIAPDRARRADGSFEDEHAAPVAVFEDKDLAVVPEGTLLVGGSSGSTPHDAPEESVPADPPSVFSPSPSPVPVSDAVPAASVTDPPALSDEQARERAAVLNIEGRDGLSADQLRAAIAAAESNTKEQ